MTYLWWNPKRVWMEVIAVDSEQPDRWLNVGGVRLNQSDLFDKVYDNLSTLYCDPLKYRFMERVRHCTLCGNRRPLDDASELLPVNLPVRVGDTYQYRWEATVDVATLQAKSYPPFLVIELCKWCEQNQDSIMAEEEEERQRRAQEADATRKAIFDEWNNLSVEDWCGQIFRCVVCCEAHWVGYVPRRYRRYNCCSQYCTRRYVEKMTDERKRLSVANLDDDYVAHLLGGIRIPPLIEAKRLNVKLKRALKAQKDLHDKQDKRVEHRNGHAA